MEMSVNMGVESGLVPSNVGLNFGMPGQGALLNEEFFVEMVGWTVREFFKGELDNFMGQFPPSRPTQS